MVKRSTSQILQICRTGERAKQLQTALKTLGFAQIISSSSFEQSIDKLSYSNYSHILFEFENPDMPLVDFVRSALEINSKLLIICVAKELNMQDIFELLKAGVKHFLVVPFTGNSLEEVLEDATEKVRLSDAILDEENRNAALAAVVMNNQYRVCVLLRQEREFPSLGKELERHKQRLHHSMEMAQICREGTEKDLLQALMDCALKRSDIKATRLGRARRKLKKKREQDQDT